MVGTPSPSTLRIARLLTTFGGSLRCFRSLRGFRRLLRPGSRRPSHPWHLADSRIHGDNGLAGAQRCELVVAMDPRIGKVPGMRRSSGSGAKKAPKPSKRAKTPKRAAKGRE